MLKIKLTTFVLALLGFLTAQSQTITVPKVLYIIGALGADGGTGDYDFDGIQFSREGDKFICQDVSLHASPEGMGDFVITAYNGKEIWNTKPAYATVLTGSEDRNNRKWVFSEGDLSYTRNIQTDNIARIMTITPGTYNFLMDFSVNPPTLTVTKAGGISTSISVPSASEETIEYFTLQGRPVKHPAKGLYIARGETSTRLVLLK